MAIVGLDVEEVTRLAQDLGRHAGHLGEVITRIDGLVSALPDVWRGYDADDFRSWWTSQHRPALVTAQEAVHHLGVTAAQNAADQAEASGGVSPSAGGGWSAAVPPMVGQPGLTDALLNGVGRTWETIDAVTSAELNGTKPWDLITSLGTAGGLNDIPGMKSIGVVGDVVQAAGYIDKVMNGTFDAQDLLDVGAEGAKNFGVVGTLVGANVQIWNDVYREAQNADFSAQGMTDTWNYAMSHPGDVVDEFGKATLEVGSRLMGYFF